MPFPNLPKPAYPNVPKLPGVPQLPRSPNFPPVVQSVLGKVEGVIWAAINAGPVWGIFNAAGKPVVQPDSVYDLNYRGEYRISDFPVQAGTFASYNKVAMPYESGIRLTKGGTEKDRIEFLLDIEAALATVELFTIITPERSYLNANLYRMGFRREARNGAYLLVVDVLFREIRQVVTQYSTLTTQNSQQASGVPIANTGRIQAAQPVQSVLRKIAGKVGLF